MWQRQTFRSASRTVLGAGVTLKSHNGMRTEMARLTLARKIAAIALTVWKKGVEFDPKKLNCTTVGLCGVIAARRLGAEQIIMLGRHADRIALAKQFGATDIVGERGDAAVERVRELTNGSGVHSVLECVGHGESMLTAIRLARPGGAVGRVGVPQEEAMPGSLPAFYNNITISGGPAPVRAYIRELLPDILEGKIEPGLVFDRIVNLDEVPAGYRAMNQREAIKVMVEP
jgi:threonine dehydrogenase-like Zn-dependent dehydrogenase